MQRDDEDDVWRAIVENYGERPTLDDEPEASEPEAGPEAGPGADPEDRSGRGRATDEPGRAASGPTGAAAYGVGLPEEPESDLGRADGERFVPPTPPPVPRPRGLRGAAWLGVFGAPAVLLLALVLSIGLPQIITLALVAAFVGGFVFLVLQMPREPRDPWDDGAQL